MSAKLQKLLYTVY